MRASGRDVRQLTQQAGDDRDPSWSPDGGKISFVSANHPSIFVMKSDGTGRRRLTEHESAFSYHSPSWSPGPLDRARKQPSGEPRHLRHLADRLPAQKAYDEYGFRFLASLVLSWRHGLKRAWN